MEWRLMTDLEDKIKAKLFEVWKKEAIRVRKHNNGWEHRHINLGKGLIMHKNQPKIQKMLDTIEDFGISLKALMPMKPSYDKLFEIYESIIVYRYAIRYIKDLKNRMETFQNFKEWRT
jgi:MoaA/NifB/PqqE/SkfB family radical SAM enzyme